MKSFASRADSENMATTSQPMKKCRSRQSTSLQDLTAMSRTSQDNEMNQDHFSLPAIHSQDMDPWTLNTSDSLESSPVGTQPETPEVTMLSYSFSQQLMPNATTGLSDSGAMFHSISDLQVAGGLSDHADMDFSQSHHFAQAIATSFFDYNYDNDDVAQRCTQDDAVSLGHDSVHEDGQLFSAQETWNLSLDTSNLVGAQYDQISHIYSPPVSPPLTEAGQASIPTACPQPAYFQVDEKTNAQDSFNPLSPPLNDQDPNRTVRVSNHGQRPLLSASSSRPAGTLEAESFTLPPSDGFRDSNEKADIRTPRDHPYYSRPTQNDGKYYCPFATGDSPCNHPPTTQKCAYHKYLDSHLKPYRCKVATCAAQNLQFSSNACLFRHEREAHGFHGHGDNPHLCLYQGCERSVAGFGFPRRWNLFDHMKRVHDYTGSEQPSSPESNAVGQVLKKKDNSGVRKRKVTKAATTSTMKRTKSGSSQGTAAKISPAQQEQRLQNAQRSYYECRSRLLEKLANITPQDTVMHEKANAALQELITLGLNFRQLEASSAVNSFAGA